LRPAIAIAIGEKNEKEDVRLAYMGKNNIFQSLPKPFKVRNCSKMQFFWDAPRSPRS